MDEFNDGRKIFASAQKEIVWSKVDDPNSWNVTEHPVAWATIKNGYPTAWAWNPEYVKTNPNMSIELYAAPPKREWVGLTVDEILNTQFAARYRDTEFVTTTRNDLIQFARELETLLREKNG